MLLMEGVQEGIRKGPWMEEEDVRLASFVRLMGERRWDSIARISGLRRTGKSCRLRWMNYLRPDLKRGRMTLQEEHLVLELHARWGNKWSRIARKLPGRTDNEIKNYWRTHIRRIAVERGEHGSPPPPSTSSSLSSSQSSTKSNEKDGIQLQDLSVENQREDTHITAQNCCDVSFQPELRIEDCYVAISPYESGMSDWISGLMNNHQDCSGDEYCLDSLWSL